MMDRMLMKYRWMLVGYAFLMLCVPAVLVAQAQNSGVWGILDSRLALIVHPAMADFDFTHGRFFRHSLAGTTKQALQEKLNAGITGAQPRLDELRKRQSEIVDARTRLLLAMDGELSELRSQRSKGAASATIDVVRQKEHEIQQRLTQGLAAYDAQLAAVDAQISETWDKTRDGVYLTAVESQARIRALLKEIGEQAQAVARETGVGFVVDTGWGMRSLKKTEDMVSIPIQSDAANLLDTMIFQNFTNWSGPRERLYSPVHDKVWSLFAAGLDEKGQETVKRIARRNPHLSVGLAGFTPGRLLLRGGYDLTPAVARRLFAAYRIPEQLKNSYMALLRDVGNTDLPRR